MSLLFNSKVMSNPFVTWWTVARQAPPAMGFIRQEYWSGLPFPSAGDLPDPGIEPTSPALAGESFTTEPPGTPTLTMLQLKKKKLKGKEKSQAGELCEIKGSKKTSQGWNFKEQDCPMSVWSFYCRTWNLSSDFLKPPFACLPHKYLCGGFLVEIAEGDGHIPRLSQGAVKTKQQTWVRGPIQTLNEFSRSRCSEAEGREKT